MVAQLAQTIAITSPESADDWAEARRLARSLIDWLAEETGYHVEDVQHDAHEELSDMAAFYRWPRGRFFIARVDGMVRGGCGVRMLDARTAELKRVYIDPEARGLGLAPRLMESVLLAARRMGAERVVLETHAPTMGKALSIYRRYGFRERLPYSDIGRLDGAVTMQLEIGSHREVA